jgi:ubiquitin C-terminal hydrolase
VRPTRRKVWAPTFRANRQQCAGETFRFLVNALDAEDYNSVASFVAPSPAAALRTTTCAAETFCLQCTVVRTCSVCSDAHSLIETGFGLELALPGKRAHVLELIQAHFVTEQLHDFKCDHCPISGTCRLVRSGVVWPRVLVLQIKRFQSIDGQMWKLEDRLDFDEILQVDSSTYCLQAVVQHAGGFRNGHYTTYVRDSSSRWFLVDDSCAPRVAGFNAVCEAQAYIMIYALVD